MFSTLFLFAALAVGAHASIWAGFGMYKILYFNSFSATKTLTLTVNKFKFRLIEYVDRILIGVARLYKQKHELLTHLTIGILSFVIHASLIMR